MLGPSTKSDEVPVAIYDGFLLSDINGNKALSEIDVAVDVISAGLRMLASQLAQVSLLKPRGHKPPCLLPGLEQSVVGTLGERSKAWQFPLFEVSLSKRFPSWK